MENSSERKYIINGKTYSRFEDIPAEFRELLKDENNNGVPDSFEAGNVLKRFFSSSATAIPEETGTEKKIGKATYTSGEIEEKKPTGTAIMRRVMFAILAGTLIVMLYFIFKGNAQQ